MKCIGFGEYEGRCENQSNGERQNPNWCDRCDKLRHRRITGQREDILKSYKKDWEGIG